MIVLWVKEKDGTSHFLQTAGWQNQKKSIKIINNIINLSHNYIITQLLD